MRIFGMRPLLMSLPAFFFGIACMTSGLVMTDSRRLSISLSMIFFALSLSGSTSWSFGSFVLRSHFGRSTCSIRRDAVTAFSRLFTASATSLVSASGSAMMFVKRASSLPG